MARGLLKWMQISVVQVIGCIARSVSRTINCLAVRWRTRHRSHAWQAVVFESEAPHGSMRHSSSLQHGWISYQVTFAPYRTDPMDTVTDFLTVECGCCRRNISLTWQMAHRRDHSDNFWVWLHKPEMLTVVMHYTLITLCTQNIHFYRAACNADAVLRGEFCPSVRLSVRLSHACIVTKRKKNLSRFLYRTKDNLA